MPAHAHQDRKTDRADADAIDRRLAEEIAHSPGDTDGASNWEASAERAFLERQFSRPCPKCKGAGAVELDARRIRSLSRKLARATTQTERAGIEQQIREESTCRVCNGVGYRPPPERRGNLQRTWCEDCEGSGTDACGETCRRCRGLRSVCLGASDGMFATVSCPRCRGCGEVPDEEVEDICQLCRGDGCTVPVTVRPVGSSRHGDGLDVAFATKDAPSAGGKAYDPDMEAAHGGDPDDLPSRPRARDEGVVEAFEQLHRERPELARVLVLYRGPIGNRWGHGHAWGRTFAVWGETPSGRLLLAEAPEDLRRRLGVRPLELLAAVRDLEDQARVPDMRRRALLTRADREARQLVDAAKLELARAAQS